MSGHTNGDEVEFLKYYTYYESYLQDERFYFENLGPNRIVGAEYKLLTYFSIKEYLSQKV